MIAGIGVHFSLCRMQLLFQMWSFWEIGIDKTLFSVKIKKNYEDIYGYIAQLIDGLMTPTVQLKFVWCIRFEDLRDVCHQILN